jgi:hypothetical protein
VSSVQFGQLGRARGHVTEGVSRSRRDGSLARRRPGRRPPSVPSPARLSGSLTLGVPPPPRCRTPLASRGRSPWGFRPSRCRTPSASRYRSSGREAAFAAGRSGGASRPSPLAAPRGRSRPLARRITAADAFHATC